jgi:hypothetical protein
MGRWSDSLCACQRPGWQGWLLLPSWQRSWSHERRSSRTSRAGLRSGRAVARWTALAAVQCWHRRRRRRRPACGLPVVEQQV